MKEEYLIDSSSSGLVSLSTQLSSNILDKNKSNEVFLLQVNDEEQQTSNDNIVTNDDDEEEEEKKNNCNEQSTSTILADGKSTVSIAGNEEEEEKEQPQQQQQQSDTLAQYQENSPSSSTEQNLINQQVVAMADDDDDDDNNERYKQIEIEEIPDEDDDLSIRNNSSIEPIDCILTDDELKPPKSSSQLPPVPKRIQRPEDDPIALRALERFEQRMSAAKTTTATAQNETNSSTTSKPRSSWSTTPSTPRKSFENLLNTSTDESTITNQRDSFIRPRKTMLDELGLNFGLTTNSKEQTQPTAIINDDNKQSECIITTSWFKENSFLRLSDAYQLPLDINRQIFFSYVC